MSVARSGAEPAPQDQGVRNTYTLNSDLDSIGAMYYCCSFLDDGSTFLGLAHRNVDQVAGSDMFEVAFSGEMFWSSCETPPLPYQYASNRCRRA